jgi:hypothetical protein
MCHRLLQPFLEIVTRAVGQMLSKRKDFSGKEPIDKMGLSPSHVSQHNEALIVD